MIKTIYHISQMDCPSEEALIRMKLESLKTVKSLEFDLDGRNLAVIHTSNDPEITGRLESLKLGTKKTSNDIIINFGVIAAALLVMATQSMIPDLVIGAIVFLIVVRGAVRILELGK